MSRRTVESNKAILAAWNKEQELVQEGKGTREWTPQQQRDILDKGKAYDDNSIAFQGQHMKSAEKYPEYQGDPGNIQFLTRAEHLEAHNGNWRNPTNWYFNPGTKEKIDFGEGEIIPCETIQLSEPIIKTDLTIEGVDAEVIENVNEVEAKKVTYSQPDIEHKKVPLNKATVSLKPMRSFGDTMRNALKSVIEFSNRHPVLTNIVKVVSVAGLAVVAEAVSNRGDSGSGSSSDNYDYNPSSNGDNSFIDIYENVFNDDTQNGECSIERSSSEEHVVRPHGQHYHTKEGLIWKEKSSYSRGGNNDE